MQAHGEDQHCTGDVQRNEILRLALQSVWNRTKNPEQHKAALGSVRN
jgi:hypothetical protein